VLLITHNLGLVARYAQRVVVLRQGERVESGETDQVLRAPSHPYTQQLVDALPRRAPTQPSAHTPRPLIEARQLSVAFRWPGAAGSGAPARTSRSMRSI
jgi:peptide/nickel transport system ATP-binding protein